MEVRDEGNLREAFGVLNRVPYSANSFIVIALG